MPAQKGRDLLLKVDDLANGTFTTVAGLRTNTLSLDAASIDITSADSAGQWRELLAGGGIRTARLAGSGVFKDVASDAMIRAHVMGGLVRPWQIVIPSFGILAGPFQVTSLEFGGRHDGEVTFEIALASAGEITFTAV